jgi:hypothetical protein
MVSASVDASHYFISMNFLAIMGIEKFHESHQMVFVLVLTNADVVDVFDIHTNVSTYRHTDIQTYRHTDIQTYRHMNIYIDIMHFISELSNLK